MRACCLTCAAPLYGSPWDRASVPSLRIDAPQSRCSRWELLPEILPMQVAGGGAKDSCWSGSVDRGLVQ